MSFSTTNWSSTKSTGRPSWTRVGTFASLSRQLSYGNWTSTSAGSIAPERGEPLRELDERLSPNPERSVTLRERDANQRATTLEALVDPLDHRTLPDVDSEIVERALYLKELSGDQVTVATSDTTMRFMALAQGLAVARMSEAER
jgi:hypothetical protein